MDIFKFKRDASAEETLAQIGEMGYADAYASDERTIYKVGVNFDSKERTLNGWEEEMTGKANTATHLE